MSQPVPGWYPDPAGSPRLRWWNGGIWTDQYLPMPGTQPQQGTPAPMRGVPLPYNAAMQQGAPQAQGASCPQATPTQQGMSSPRVPSSQQAPKVHSNPYQNTGITPVFSNSEDSANREWLVHRLGCCVDRGRSLRRVRRVRRHGLHTRKQGACRRGIRARQCTK